MNNVLKHLNVDGDKLMILNKLLQVLSILIIIIYFFQRITKGF